MSVRRWLNLTGALALAGGVACLLAAAWSLPGAIAGIALVVYGICALSTQVGAPEPKR
jgi:hypothetical protein